MDNLKNTLNAITRTSQSSSLYARLNLVMELMIDLQNRRNDLEEQIKKLKKEESEERNGQTRLRNINNTVNK
jgi:uncharacterized protein YlxW (UPF0749 family)